MHIPPFYKKQSWQRFFVGVFFGALIAYIIVLFMYGRMYEDLLERNMALQSELNDVKKQNESLLETNENLDEQSKQPITVKEIELFLMNKNELKLDTFTTHKLEELVKEEINHLIGKDIETVAKSDELLTSTIQNKVYDVDDFSYKFKIIKLTISSTIKITVEAELET